MNNQNIQKVPIKTLLKNLLESGGHPSETKEHSDRSLYIEEFTRRGANNILKELGYSLRKSTIWRNRWTGNEETLKDLITPDENGIKFRREKEDSEIMFVLENWMPSVGENTIKEEYDRQNRKKILSDTAVQEALI